MMVRKMILWEIERGAVPAPSLCVETVEGAYDFLGVAE